MIPLTHPTQILDNITIFFYSILFCVKQKYDKDLGKVGAIKLIVPNMPFPSSFAAFLGKHHSPSLSPPQSVCRPSGIFTTHHKLKGEGVDVQRNDTSAME